MLFQAAIDGTLPETRTRTPRRKSTPKEKTSRAEKIKARSRNDLESLPRSVNTFPHRLVDRAPFEENEHGSDGRSAQVKRH